MDNVSHNLYTESILNILYLLKITGIYDTVLRNIIWRLLEIVHLAAMGYRNDVQS
jgi:hypothetical protein